MAIISRKNKRQDVALSTGALLRAYEKMFLIRVAEEKIAALYLKNKIMSFVHFYIGQEAVAVGVADSIGLKDKMLGNHRSHGHYLAKGGDLKRMVCELLGKEGGLAKGKGGSMHMVDRSVNFVGSTPILGSVVPLSCGVAFEQKYNKRKSVTVAFLGDGAFEEGVIYETINLAGLFKLPLLIVVENNLYSVNSPLKDRRAEGHNVAKIVRGFGAKYIKADGKNYRDVRVKAGKMVAYLRKGNGPGVLECFTHRHMAHSAPIFDESSRKEDVLEKRLQQDSIKRLRSELRRAGVSEKKLASIESEKIRYADESIAFAFAAPYPKPETLYTNVFAR
ncbi:MAG: thiamine pyrophosphate-dependent dehydrogenase E1 component subunit alpha [bacterium]|nr:thiamine pyrophosphate-dependent dehydrogenase E1 component subunit alpha [bacterium]